MVPLLDSPMYGALLVAVTYLKFSLRPADESLAQKSSPPAAVAGELNAGGFQGGFGGGAWGPPGSWIPKIKIPSF